MEKISQISVRKVSVLKGNFRYFTFSDGDDIFVGDLKPIGLLGHLLPITSLTKLKTMISISKTDEISSNLENYSKITMIPYFSIFFIVAVIQLANLFEWHSDNNFQSITLKLVTSFIMIALGYITTEVAYYFTKLDLRTKIAGSEHTDFNLVYKVSRVNRPHNSKFLFIRALLEVVMFWLFILFSLQETFDGLMPIALYFLPTFIVVGMLFFEIQGFIIESNNYPDLEIIVYRK